MAAQKSRAKILEAWLVSVLNGLDSAGIGITAPLLGTEALEEDAGESEPDCGGAEFLGSAIP
jgi:hypothetical protein